MTSCITSVIQKRRSAPSRELKMKKDRFKNHKGIYGAVETKVYDVAGGVSMTEVLKLQRRIKESTGIKTSRVDWRTKTGVILWFCVNWNRINPIIDSFKQESSACLTDSSETEQVSSPQVQSSINAIIEQETFVNPFDTLEMKLLEAGNFPSIEEFWTL